MQRVTAFGLLLPLSLVLVLGCDLEPTPVGEDPGETSTSGDTSAGPGGTGQVTTSPTGDPIADSGGFLLDVGAGMTETGITTDPTEGGDDIRLDVAAVPCDPLLQDCPRAEACYPRSDHFGCSGPPGGGQSGDACGMDEECDVGLFCADGFICRAFCDVIGGSACADPAEICEPWYPMGMAPPGLENLGWCTDDIEPPPAMECDPLLQDCFGGDGCYPNPFGGGFLCDTAGSAQAGDPCGAGCDIGLLCDAGLCAEICDTAAPTCSDPGHTCIDYYAPGAAPPGLETVGYCAP